MDEILRGRLGTDYDRHLRDHREAAPGCAFCLDAGARDHCADIRRERLAMTGADRARHARDLALAA